MENNKKLRRYRVVFAVSFTVDAESEGEAVEIAYKKLIEELNNPLQDLLNIFGVDVEELGDEI